MLESLQDSWLAHAIGESQVITAGLSAAHVVGFTLVMSSAVLANLRLSRLMLSEMSWPDIVRPAGRVLSLGLVISLSTGVLLFVPRAAGAAANGIFRLKLLLLAAALTQFVVVRRWRGRDAAAVPTRLTGIAGLALWVGLGVTACAFILVE